MSDGVGFPGASDTIMSRMVVAAEICWITWLWFAEGATAFWSELALKTGFLIVPLLYVKFPFLYINTHLLYIIHYRI